MELKNKVAIVTGGSTGIGSATIDLLKEKGCVVYNIDRLEPTEIDPYFLLCDVSNKVHLQKTINKIIVTEGRIDFLFANAGVHLLATIEETSEEDFIQLININIAGVFYALQCVIPVMKIQNKGSIVIMGSDQAFVGKNRSAAYGLTKGAVAQLTKSTALDYASYNIRVNCICPGTINTPLLDRVVAQISNSSNMTSTAVISELAEAQPLARIGEAMEIAKSVVFLLSDDSSFTTGTLMAVDGGYTAR